MNASRQQGPFRGRSLLVGWLYADLLLVLMLAALGGVLTKDEEPPVCPVCEEPVETGLRTEPVSVFVGVDAAALRAGDEAAEQTFREEFRDNLEGILRQEFPDEQVQVGMSLTWADGVTVDQAQFTAGKANDQVEIAATEYPYVGFVMRKAVPPRAFANLSMDPDTIEFELYVLQGVTPE